MSAILEDVKDIKIDDWKTLNTAASSTKLKPGESPNMLNVWVDEKPGSVITANGLIKVGTLPSGNPATFGINYFKTSAGTQTVVVSDNQTVYTTTDFQTFTSIITGLSSSFQLRGMVIRDKLWLTNGSDSVRTFDGSTVTALDGTGGTPTAPKGRFIAYNDERVWLYHTSSKRSGLFFSALADSSGTAIAPDDASAWPSSNEIEVSEGDADFGTGLLLYRGYLYAFKQYSIWRVIGYDEYTYSRVKTRASTGTRFAESMKELDSLVHLIGTDGLYVFDGEQTERISDIIDPASASQASFGFNQLQQPNTNNKFWQTTQTADWNTGTVPRNVDVDDEVDFVASDTSITDFSNGTTQTNIDFSEVPGKLKLARDTSGGSSDAVSLTDAFLDDGNNGAVVYGVPSYLTDGNTSRGAGLGVLAASSNRFVVNFADAVSDVGRVILYGIQADTDVVASIQVNIGAVQTKYGNQGTWVTVDTFHFKPGAAFSPYNQAYDFTVQEDVVQVSILFTASGGSYQIGEIEVYKPKYKTTGSFVSVALDYGAAPTSYGNFNADVEDNGQDLAFYTQSSDDGVTWDAIVAVTDGGAIASTVKRYLRWRADFDSDGTYSQIISAAYLPAMYTSAIHDTGGSIFSWGAFEADYALAGQTIKFYYRAATSSAGVSAAAWNLIVPGGIVNTSVLNKFIQFKFMIEGGDSTHMPIVTSVTVNWIVGTGLQQSILQNVSSVVWRNRYWLSAAGNGATANDTILIRGKKTFGFPFMLKDWEILTFFKFNDDLYGCSSVDGSIYQLDTGYSIDGSEMDSLFETGDYTFGGFYASVLEVDIEVERMGPYFLSVGISTDRGNTYTEMSVDLTESTYASNYIKRLNFNIQSDRVRFRVRVNGADKPFQVHNLRAFYRLSQARGSIQ